MIFYKLVKIMYHYYLLAVFRFSALVEIERTVVKKPLLNSFFYDTIAHKLIDNGTYIKTNIQDFDLPL